MAHHVYQTDAIVLSASPEGEASGYFKLLTRELGLVGGTAQSVRAEKSKLRYGLQEYSRSSVSLVRGKDRWRIVNAVPVENFYFAYGKDKAKMAACARISALVKKLVAGEGRNEPLFDEVLSVLSFLEEPLDREELASVQLVSALRILRLLGYGSPDPSLEPFALGSGWDRSALAAFGPHAKEARAAIRRALSATHL